MIASVCTGHSVWLEFIISLYSSRERERERDCLCASRKIMRETEKENIAVSVCPLYVYRLKIREDGVSS